jgi:hypothetical protein
MEGKGSRARAGRKDNKSSCSEIPKVYQIKYRGAESATHPLGVD